MQKYHLRRGASLARNLLTGTALVSAALVGAAHAQAPAESEAIVVTGSSIRGAPPVGSNLISVTRADLLDTNAQTAQQLLKTVPAVVGLSAVGQGGFQSFDGAGTNAPTIHGLGGSASNQTLILVDGHRFPLGGLNHTLGDPNIIPPIAMERVEVLPDGASSVYGSDAVAGVINFITRRAFDGVEVNAQTGFGDAYTTYSAGLAAGTTWDGGYALAAYGYSERSQLSYMDRPWIDGNNIDRGGTNFNSINCPIGVISSGTTAWQYPYTTSFANTVANRPCNTNIYSDLVPKESRHSTLVKVSHELTEQLTVSVDTVFSDRRNRNRNSRGNINTATITSANNPFFTRPAGTTLTSVTVNLSMDELLGPGAYTASGEQTWFIDPKVEYRFNDAWSITASTLFGHNLSTQTQFGALCVSCATQALTGAALGPTPSGLSVPAITLTTANALDPFNPLATNRTNPAVLAGLIDTPRSQISRHTIQDYRLQLNGELFQLPGGPIKTAVGAEFVNYELTQDNQNPLNLGLSRNASSFTHLDYQRDVKSAFIEFLVPIVGPDQGIPGIQSLDVNVAGRYDEYNDFGNTTNPKVGINWGVMDGLKFRASYAKSFVAPALTSFGADSFGTTSESVYTGTTIPNVPFAVLPGVAAIPNVTCGADGICRGGAGALAVNGFQVNGGSAQNKAQEGTSWSVGGDFNPSFIPGLRTSLTFWHNEVEGAITAPQQSIGIQTGRLYLYPAGMTPAQIAGWIGTLPVNTPLAAGPQYYVYDNRQGNVLNMVVEGIDAEANYRQETSFGSIQAGVALSRKTKFDQGFGNLPYFDILNTSGVNLTFPSIGTDLRANVGFDAGPISASLFMNYTGEFTYRNTQNSVSAITFDAAGNPSAGGDTVKAYTTFDLNVAYQFSEDMMGAPEVYIDVNNVADERPPFENNANSFDAYAGNPIGRVISVGLRAKF